MTDSRYLPICPSCRWYDCTQKQCFDGHIQNKSTCDSYEFDNRIPTKKEIQAETIKLMNLMLKAKISGEYISFFDGSKIEVKISKEKSQND